MSRKRAGPRSEPETAPIGLRRLASFPLLSALQGRRSRRFAAGASIPQGPFAFTSDKAPQPLSEIETAVVTGTMAGPTGWQYLIPFNGKYAPKLPNYAGSATGRTFPSAAGFQTSELFFTDDSGIYFFSSRDRAPRPAEELTGRDDTDIWLRQFRSCTKKVSNERLQMPQEEPHIESHNLWIANAPGSLLAIPVIDLAQHMILGLCYWVQNGWCLFDDINGERIPGLEKFKHLVDIANPYPLSYAEQTMLGEAAVEIATSCYAGALMLQAMGLGGWMYDGIDRHSIFGVSGDPRNKGLGFRADTNKKWAIPNPTGCPGVFEAACPPHFVNMRAAVEAVVNRKFAEGGPFNGSTPGPWKDSARVRNAAAPHTAEFIECVTLMADYIYDRFEKFPATIPSTYCLMYLQAHHLDLSYYDELYGPGAYLETHRFHDRDWH